MKKQALIFTSLLLSSIILGNSGKPPRLEIITSKTSCTQNCDGSARVLFNNGDETLLYEWLDNNNQLLRRSIFPRLQDACEGKYKVRIIKKKTLNHRIIPDLEFEEVIPLKVLRFSAKNNFKISVGFEVKARREFKDLNEKLNILYSLDQGRSWTNGGNIHSLKSSITGFDVPSLIYSSILPSEVDEQQIVWVAFTVKGESNYRKLKKSIKKNSYEIFHIYRKHVPFRIESKTKVEVNSYVSHELNGSDGLIVLDVYGGHPPYSYKWNFGSNLNSVGKLQPGNYSVVIKDSKKCELKRYFSIKPLNEILASDLKIDLSPTKKKGHYDLNIGEIYNKIIYMYVHSDEEKKIKQFFIHPLENDVKIPVDLSLLSPGNYVAEYIVEDLVKRQNFNIK